MSRYPPNYDSNESRRSPRDQSPGRYNDSRDDSRGGTFRGSDRRRSSIGPEARMNHNPNVFTSKRDLFANRDTFSSRDPPRGPRGVPDAPTGPRAAGYNDTFGGGFRGDRDRGRGRGRGSWRDDSRDRERNIDRDYRDRRDDRGPPNRDNFSRDRWAGREPASFGRGGRRPASPQGRGRSPTYNPRDSRDTRDGPPSLDIDRTTRRNSRDGPLSGGSPHSETTQTFRGGFGRGRGGGHGRGRGGYYDEPYHRVPGRSRSPENGWSRRTQPSATPPPQVPAFGSSSNNIPLGPSIPTGPAAATANPLPGIAVPTAPRSDRAPDRRTFGPDKKPPFQNRTLIIDNSKKELIGPPSHSASPTTTKHPPLISPNSPKSAMTTESRDYSRNASAQPSPIGDDRPQAQTAEDNTLSVKLESRHTKPEPSPVTAEASKDEPRRRPIIGKMPPKVPKQARLEIPDVTSDSDSADDFDDNYFEREITKIQNELSTLRAADYQNPLEPRPEPDAVFLQPFMDSMIDDIIQKVTSTIKEPCNPPAPEPKPVVSETPRSTGLAPKPKTNRRSRPSTPLVEKTPMPSPRVTNGQIPSATNNNFANGTTLRRSPSLVPRPPSFSEIGEDEDEDAEGDSDDAIQDTPYEPQPEELEAVKDRMRTPPISSLPKFGIKKWYEDEEYIRTLASSSEIDKRIRNKLVTVKARVLTEQRVETEAWLKRYKEYREWTDFSNDAAAVRSRETFSKSRAAAVDKGAPNSRIAAATAAAKPEAGRRERRYGTEHDLERVLQESMKEAEKEKEREAKEKRASTASAKECQIPDMIWDPEEKARNLVIDQTRIVAFERSFARLEFGEPIDNFTDEENAIFEKMYLENPKEWGKIAAALPNRDYKTCIQHYYLVKHIAKLKDKIKQANGKTKKKKTMKKSARTIGLVADADDAPEVEINAKTGRPKRAAAPTFSFETPASENGSEISSPAPPQTGRKRESVPKGGAAGANTTASGNAFSESSPVKKPKATRTPKEKAPKQPKSSQLLAAAPPANRRAESPATPMPPTEWNNRRESSGTPRFAPVQFDPRNMQPFPQPFTSLQPAATSLPDSFEPTPQSFSPQERLGSVPPVNYDPQMDRNKTTPQSGPTSSYWSVPEQTDFPALLKHFGTDWHAIAKHMTSKTHIMVYNTAFSDWLKPSVDKTTSRQVANIQKQVKNYYQRQVDSGKFKEYEEYARDADEKKRRGESTGEPPQPTPIPKRRYDLTPGSGPRSGSVLDSTEDLMSGGHSSILSHASPPQPQSLSTRFPALAQAGPVPQIQSTASVIGKHMPQHIQQAPPTSQPQQRPPRGPPLGYFEAPQRPGLPSSDSGSQRALLAAQEAQKEQEQAQALQRQRETEQQQLIQKEQELRQQRELALIKEREVHMQVERRKNKNEEQMQLQVALQRERSNFPLKQENEMKPLQQYEPYMPHTMRPGSLQPSRPDDRKPLTPNATERPKLRHRELQGPLLMQGPYGGRTPPDGPINHRSVSNREIRASPAPTVANPIGVPPPRQEPYPTPRSVPPLPAPAAVRQQETVRKTSNIMDLLNNDAADSQPTPPKRVSDIASGPQASRTPPPQHALQPPRYGSHTPHTTSQPPSQMTAHSAPQQHAYGAPQTHSLHQHSSSIGQPRSYTPTGYDSRGPYAPPSLQNQQQQMYSPAPPRPTLNPQPPLRREHSANDALSGGYSRTPGSSQPASRLKDNPYSAAASPQVPRQPAANSPHESHPLTDYRRPHESYPGQQQGTSGSPQQGPAYSTSSPSTYQAQQQLQQHQQQQPNHRQYAFGPGSAHAASPPPPSFVSQRASLHGSRHNSFDGRGSQNPMPTSTSLTSQPQLGYQPPQSQAPLGMQQYGQQQHPNPGPGRFDPYAGDRGRHESDWANERERIIEHENQYRMRIAREREEEKRRLEERR